MNRNQENDMRGEGQNVVLIQHLENVRERDLLFP